MLGAAMNFGVLRLYTITMYRLMLYFMIALLAAAAGLSALGVLPYSAWNIFWQTALFVAICWAANTLIARLLKIRPNIESSLITGLILAAIMGPLVWPRDIGVVAVAAIAAMASKYIFVWRRSHIFNPAAFGAVVSALAIGHPASWWAGGQELLPVIVVGGVILMQKIRRWHLIVSFLTTYIGLMTLDTVLIQGGSVGDVIGLIQQLSFSSLLFFFAFVMLIEPLTAPQTNFRRVWFGAGVGLALFSLQRFVPSIPYSLELSLLAGNVFARIINPDFRQAFILRRKEMLDSVMGNFWFEPARPFVFVPGQFLEYTLAHPRADVRGVRRYYTIASSPTENEVLLATKFSQPGSTFKEALRQLNVGEEVVASKVAGEFVLPSSPSQKLAFIAGGIGITPFRSMVRYLLHTHQARDIILVYGARTEKELVFREIFEEARRRFGMKNVYAVTRPIDEATIREAVPDLTERVFYISGPEPMVQGLTKLLITMRVPRKQIKRDYFPGYAERV